MRFKNKNIRHGKAFTENSQCSICKKEFPSIAKLAIHVKVIHEDQKVKKPQYGSISPAQKYVQSFHKGKQHQCDECNKKFLTKKKLLLHVESVHEGKKINCSYCKVEVTTKKQLMVHIQTVHPPRGINGHQGHLDTLHPISSAPNQSFGIGKTNENKTEQRNNDVQTSHGLSGLNEMTKSWLCEFCKKYFSSQTDLKMHVSRIHEGKKPFECIICNTSFAYKKDLNEHKVGNHEIAVPYNCGNCKSGFWRKQELFEHVSSSHEGKGAEVYQTTEETDSEKSQIDQKKETIACGKGKFLVGCAMCGKNFTEANILAEHIELVHKGTSENHINNKHKENNVSKNDSYLSNHGFNGPQPLTKNGVIILPEQKPPTIPPSGIPSSSPTLTGHNCVTCNIEFLDLGSFDKHSLTIHSSFLQNVGMKSGFETNHGHQLAINNDVKLPPEQPPMLGGFDPSSGPQTGLPIEPLGGLQCSSPTLTGLSGGSFEITEPSSGTPEPTRPIVLSGPLGSPIPKQPDTPMDLADQSNIDVNLAGQRMCALRNNPTRSVQLRGLY